MKRFLVLAALISFGAHARPYDYECFSFYWNGYEGEKGTMDLTVNARKATADIHEVTWDEDLGGNLDTSYQSRGDIPYVRFGEIIAEKSLLTGGRRLRDGNWGGFARVEGQAEGGFYQYKFICKLK
jgi:hypothetical protein